MESLLIKAIKSSSKYNIVDSGTLFNFEKEDAISISYTFDEKFSFIVELLFTSDKDKERSIKTDVLNQTIIINCTNFDNPLGTGTIKPIELASYSGKKIFMHFWVYSLGEESVRKVDYCLYQEK